MMTTFVRCVLVAVLVGAGAVGAAGDQSAKGRAFSDLKAEFPSLQSYSNGNRLTRLFGTTMANGVDSQDTAGAFLREFAPVFGVGSDNLVPAGVDGNGVHIQPVMYDHATGEYRFTLVRFVQQTEQIPVFRADLRLLMRNEPGNPLVLAASSIRDLGEFQIGAALREEVGRGEYVQSRFPSARDAALAESPALLNFSEPKVVVWAGVDDMVVEPMVALQFLGDNAAPGSGADEKWLFIADLDTGAILYQENQLIDVDVVGNVSGMASELSSADFCELDVMTAMPYARVNIGGTTAFADENGDFVIPNGGSSPVTVESPIRGEWFRVFNQAGSDTELSQSVTPPGPADFVHNPAGTELVRAEVNAYIQANAIRDFVLNFNPSFPTLQSTEFTIWVNRTDVYCPRNAWYDPSDVSINFCRASGDAPNTAWSSVVYHEYGHHLVQAAGSGQGEYGEGFGDVMSGLITDESGLGFGFYGDCVDPLRDAADGIQYPCSGGSHDCGRVLSGCVWDTRVALEATNPTIYGDIIANLAINSVLMHSGTSITPSITIDFLTLDDDDGDINNGTPHWQEICAGFGAHNMDCPALAAIAFDYPEGRPDMVAPSQTTTFPVNVVSVSGTPVSGTGQLHYSIDGGAFTAVAMTETAPNEYEATLPAGDCGSQIAWYVSATASGIGTLTDPSGAPFDTFESMVATGIATIFVDEFESDNGWTVGAPDDDASTGIWSRNDPEGTQAQPGDDHTPSPGTDCFVTDHRAGSSLGDWDVDGGQTTLRSPVFDASAGPTVVSYWRWYSNDTGADPNNDVFVVDISANGGSSWTRAETVGPSGVGTSGGWYYHEFLVSDIISPTSNMQIRFIASDESSGSLVEAAIDDFTVFEFECLSAGDGDFDVDGDVDLADFDGFQRCFGVSPVGAACGAGDLNGDDLVDLGDFDLFAQVLGGPQ